MNSFPRFARNAALVSAASLALFVTGCRNPFVARHKVMVDAISAPGQAKPAGQSYRLVAKKSVVSQVAVQIPVVKACVDAGLVGLGMFEAPENAAPDIFIEVGFGIESAPRADPSARESFLQLSARSNPGGSLDRATGSELWDVRVSVLGIAGRLESAMPLLSYVAAGYVASDTRVETTVEIPQNSPMVAAVRNTAIKALEAKGRPAAADAGGAGGAGGAPPPTAPGK